MPASTAKSAFVGGLADSLPFLLVGVPFAMLFGVLAESAGLGVLQTLMFSVVVIAGASQFTAVQLIDDGAPALVVLAAALAVNLRMAMYSASLQPWLGRATLAQRALVAYLNVDASYALAVKRFEEIETRLPDRLAYFFGTMVLTAPLWYVGTLAGALMGARVFDGIALDFAMPILFLALVGPMVKTLAHLGAAVASVVVALGVAWMPSGVGLLVAAFVAMVVGAEIERRRA